MQIEAGAFQTTAPLLARSRILTVFAYVEDLACSRAFYGVVLGLREVESGAPGTATYDVGQVLLTLVPAAAHGVRLATPDDSTDIVFLVDDVAAMIGPMERRGVRFQRQRT